MRPDCDGLQYAPSVSFPQSSDRQGQFVEPLAVAVAVDRRASIPAARLPVSVDGNQASQSSSPRSRPE